MFFTHIGRWQCTSNRKFGGGFEDYEDLLLDIDIVTRCKERVDELNDRWP